MYPARLSCRASSKGTLTWGGAPADQKTLRLSLQRGITTVCSVSANVRGIELRNGIITARVDQIHHGAFIDKDAVHGIKEEDLFYVPTLAVTCQT